MPRLLQVLHFLVFLYHLLLLSSVSFVTYNCPCLLHNLRILRINQFGKSQQKEGTRWHINRSTEYKLGFRCRWRSLYCPRKGQRWNINEWMKRFVSFLRIKVSGTYSSSSASEFKSKKFRSCLIDSQIFRGKIVHRTEQHPSIHRHVRIDIFHSQKPKMYQTDLLFLFASPLHVRHRMCNRFCCLCCLCTTYRCRY